MLDRHTAERWTGIMPESWTGFAGMRNHELNHRNPVTKVGNSATHANPRLSNIRRGN
jgi:hypothetical protein